MDRNKLNSDFDEAEKDLEEAKKLIRGACDKIGLHIPIPFHIDLAKLHLRHAIQRFRVRRERLKD